MGHLPAINGKTLLGLLQKLGFQLVRVNGSHHRLRHPDGRVTTVPVHGKDDLPKGLLRKIIREDMKISLEEFTTLLSGGE